MAIGMLSVRVGKKGKALPHSQYIAKLGKFAKDSDQVEYQTWGNMPDWVKSNDSQGLQVFWEMADLHERKNGSVYREHIIALPREFNVEQKVDLVNEWIDNEMSSKYPLQAVIHNKIGLDGGEQPHLHLMFNERVNDGIYRPAEQLFKRYNSKYPSQGGAKKDNTGLPPWERKTQIKNLRERWEILVNEHLLKNGFEPTVDMRNWQERGLESEPENYSMGMMNDPEFRQAYSEMVTARRELYEFAPIADKEFGLGANIKPTYCLRRMRF